jgi:hypothetical protein
MFNRILPAEADNTYRGRTLAIWLFGLIACVRAAQGLGSIFRGREVLSMTDGIPIALANGIIAVIAIVVLFRYRAGTPPGTVINLVLLGTTVFALGASLWRRDSAGPAPARPAVT